MAAPPPKKQPYKAPNGTAPKPLLASDASASGVAAAPKTPGFVARRAFNPLNTLLLEREALLLPGGEEALPPVLARKLHTVHNKQRCAVNCVTWTPDGSQLVTGTALGEFTLWSASELGKFNTIIQAHDGVAVRAMRWSHAGLWLLSSDDKGCIKYWQSSMNCVKKLAGAHEGTAVRGLAVGPHDAKFVTGGDSGSVCVWDLATAAMERQLGAHGQDVRATEWHATKGLIASCSRDSAIKLWDPRGGGGGNKALRTLHVHNLGVAALAFDGEGGNYLLSGGRDTRIKLQDLRKLSNDAVLCSYTAGGLAAELSALSWYPGSAAAFVTGGVDGSVQHWAVDDLGPPIVALRPHDSVVWDFAWHPSGRALASASNDFATHIWGAHPEGVPVPGAVVAPPVAPAQAITTPLGPQMPPASYVCHTCNTKGHWREECPEGGGASKRKRA
jgi:polyadenylation factor subunit 2